MVRGLERIYGDRITFVRVNILNPENAALLEQFSFSTTPEFYLVDGEGKIIGTWDETAEEEGLRQAFDQALSQTGE